MRPGLARPLAGRPVAAHDPPAPARPGGRARLVALAGTELEFIVFDTTYEDAPDAGYQDLTPVNQYNVDYSILGTTRVEPLLRDIRNHMYAAGHGRRGRQGRVQLRPARDRLPLRRRADHRRQPRASTRPSAKEIAAQHGKSLTFMAKYDEREGNSCHIHLSLRGADGDARLLGRATGGVPPLYDHFIAGVLATMRGLHPALRAEHQLLQAVRGRLVRPDHVAWGLDNRTCAVRLVGHGRRRPDGEPGARRRRQPLPRAGRDAGRRPARHRERAARWRTELVGNAYTSDKAAGARTRCARPATRSPPPTVARAAFGDEVVDHYANMADVELAAFDAAVTDWELLPRLREDVSAA